MHEMALAESVLQIIEDYAMKQRFTRVKSVCIEIGALSGVELEALRFCFDAVTRGSLAQGAQLQIIDVPGSGWCMQCGTTVAMEERYSACPRCQSYGLQPSGGTQMRVKELEVD
jgi:hydrogenase nickel incorporation protein HypA/HybF